MVKSKIYWGHLWGQQGGNHEFRRLMLKIKIPPRSRPAKPDTETPKPETEKDPSSQFWTWWQKAFEEPEDLLEYNAGQLSNAVELAAMVENYISGRTLRLEQRERGLSFGGTGISISHGRKRLNRTRLMVKTRIKK